MKCPRCGLIVTDEIPKCKGCNFSIADLERKIKKIPKRSGYVNDFAELLSEDNKKKIEDHLIQFHKDTGGEMVVVTIKSTKPLKPSEYIFWLFNRWQVGGESHAGLMLLLAISERRIESEVGYSWEHIITDSESGEVLNDHVVPLLKEGKFAEALYSGVEKLAEIIKQAKSFSEEENSL
ncbi:TPA: TPM domain-containing protein [bacterium]|nr:TPM domain-containing protein [bacterium]